MSFSLPDYWVWDFWFADDGDQYHLFYLRAPKDLGDPDLRHRNATIGHATSTDLTNWSDHGLVLGPGEPDEFDATATWTGSIVRGDDNLWRMFYTGARFLPDGGNIETIGVAVSEDLIRWTKRPGPVTRADPRWYETFGTSSWPEEAWRDPWVFHEPTDGLWHMLITARANNGPDDDRGVIGHATSPDLDTWAVQAPLSMPCAGFGHLEVVQTTEIDRRPTLIFSCPTDTLSGTRQGDGVTGGIWAIPYTGGVARVEVSKATLLAHESLYSGRILKDRAGRDVMLAFTNDSASSEFTGSITDPILVSASPDPLLLAPTFPIVMNVDYSPANPA
ncbi:MAG: glycosyl hydrolase family 32 [Leifsonia sp.]